jgi:large subunit ribosomal protein L22
METYIAKLNNIRITPQKLDLVVDMVRKQPVEAALQQLQFVNKKAAKYVSKALQSAVANAEHNFGVKSKDLVVETAFVTQALTYKRGRAVARGRYFRMLRRGSNLTIKLAKAETK